MDLSWSELLVVGIIALIFIGPKDLPGMFRELGRFAAKVRAMGREFSRAMEAAAKESGVKDVADDLKKVANPKAMGMDAVKSAADKFEKWDPLKPAAAKTAAAATVAAAAPAAAASTPTSPAANIGPATAALAEKVAERKAAASETATRLRAEKSAAKTEARTAPVVDQTADQTAAPAATSAAAAAPKRGGRVRKKAEAAPGEEA